MKTGSYEYSKIGSPKYFFHLNSLRKYGPIRFWVIFALAGCLLLTNHLGAYAADIKWHPGHYMRFKVRHGEDRMRQFLKNSYTKGIHVQIPWKDLEPSRGKYDFSSIDNLLRIVKSYNKYLMINVEERCFNENCADAEAPSYIVNSGGVTRLYYDDGEPKGSVAKLWNQNIMDRLIALLTAIGRRYDGDPAFVGIADPDETALGSATGQGLPEYSAKKYITQLKRQVSALAEAMPRTLTFIGINWFPGLDREKAFTQLAEHLESVGTGGLSHPDTRPNEKTNVQYVVEGRFQNRIAIAPQMQTAGLQSDETEERMYDMAINQLGANFIIWNEHFTTRVPKYDVRQNHPNYVPEYVFPIINKYRGRTNTRCPSSFDGCIESNTVPAAPVQETEPTIEKAVIPQKDAVDVYQYFNGFITDHKYITERNDSGMAAYAYGYEQVAFRILPEPSYPGATELFHYWNPTIGDNYYTTKRNDAAYANYGYEYVTIVGYVFDTPQNYTNVIPVYQYSNNTGGDHFYTTERNDGGLVSSGYSYDTIAFYAVAPPSSPTPAANAQSSDVVYDFRDQAGKTSLNGAVFNGTEALYIYYTGAHPSNLDIVNFKLDDAYHSSDLQAPYKMNEDGVSLDLNTLSEGRHSVTAVLKDANRNLITETTATFTIRPNQGASGTQQLDIVYDFRDQEGISGLNGTGFNRTDQIYIYYTGPRPSNLDIVNFKLDDAYHSSDLQAPYKMCEEGMPLNLSTLSPGEHIVTAVLKDANRNLITQTSATFVVR